MKYQAPVDDMMFLIEEWLGIERLTGLPGFEDLDSDALRFMLEEAGRFCASELLPINATGDAVGAVLDSGEVRTPPGFREAYRKFVEGGWTSIDSDPEYGGQGLPRLLQFMVDEMLAACNLAFKLYTELSHGAGHLVAASASEDLRRRYLPNMIAGRWTGTMCLTEPHCGTDLGLLNTRATPQPDGSYRINGTKIFITSGDHDLTENIVHLVLARVDGAPAGSHGISTFLVPRNHVREDGSVGERNSVKTGSLEHKMGIRGSATAMLHFEDATGYLVGEENRGLVAMFTMMNIERITVGIQGLGIAEIACQNALDYACERLQSRAPEPRPDPSKRADPLVYHPEIRRMLLRMRSQIEGGRALAIYTALHTDLMHRAPSPEERKGAADTVALLTPIVKSYLSDLAVTSSLSAQQVFGGHGYIREWGMEQLVRDSRITPIYEGTNEVQALDLVTRKLSLDGGRLVDAEFSRWARFLEAARKDRELEGIIGPAAAAFERLADATGCMRQRVLEDDAAARGAATEFQRLFALTTVAILWAQVVAAISGKQGEIYERKRKLARFYMSHVLPETIALHKVITEGAEDLAEFDAASLTGQVRA
ncbi:MAG: acyl-CoA dehydrogenase family protein [Gammaproteobacteria bacterium]|nr:acyl-CoA dehydrogenase family protein [Gammaproteobacteria bacterium]MDH4254583.1 acyl-CoA dehydrogenase family protein [Gammaproteobacteria bacterium]MDH5310458.1 acyl-CoA dehydrogenase family protein [Gammaproteobacteria bacterium]